MATKKPSTTTRKVKRKPKPLAPEDKPLDEREKAFVREYLVRLQPMQAALAAGYSVTTAKTLAYTWTSNNKTKPHVYKAVHEAMQERSRKTEITSQMVLEHWWKLAKADPNELTQHRRLACRNCYGIDHKYQWIDEDEYEKACASVEEGAPIPDDAGGYGYEKGNVPHPYCPKCGGEGKAEVFIADTRHLSEEARLLYAGTKLTAQGLEIKMHDQAKALENVAKHLGMFKENLSLGIEEDNPLGKLIKAISGNTLRPGETPTDEQLEDDD